MKQLPIVIYWNNTKLLPFLLRPLIQGAMVVPPLLRLLLLLALPITNWEVDGGTLTYTELWASGVGATMALILLNVSVGAWGIAARRTWARWLLVASPASTYIVLLAVPANKVSVDFEAIVVAGLTTVTYYIGLFHITAVRDYFSTTSNDI